MATYLLLGLSICAVWAPPLPVRAGFAVHGWTLLFAAAMASGLASGVLTWPALIPLTLLILASLLATRCRNPALRSALTLTAAIITLALALHVLPGFYNLVVVSDVHLSENAASFTQYASFDKAAAGLVLLAIFCRRTTSIDDARKIAAPTLLAGTLTTLAVISCGLAVHYIEFDPKVPTFALVFLGVNLLFTCVAEEAFFRGLLQERLAIALGGRRSWIAVSVSSALFGLAHFAGGGFHVGLATIAGIGYSVAYAATRRIESAILAHFSVNAIHFLAFTYPHIAP